MDLKKHESKLEDIGYFVSSDQVVTSRGDVVGVTDPYGSFICDIKEIVDIVSQIETKEEIKYKRARNEDGHFIADDPETLDINEAWVKV